MITQLLHALKPAPPAVPLVDPEEIERETDRDVERHEEEREKAARATVPGCGLSARLQKAGGGRMRRRKGEWGLTV